MVESKLAQGVVGSLLFVTDPAEINRLQRLAVEGNRFGIPLLFGFDVIHGLRTIFPVPIAMAASWDPETIEAGQVVAAREARAVGIHWTFAPMVDIARDPRWGRIIEGAGEDPYLGAAVAAAQVRGFQGPELGTPERVIAGPKHLAGYGYALGGRDYDEVNLSDSELWNVVLPPFRAAVEAGAGNVMTGLHGPQRHPRHRQPVAVHRGAARHARLRGLRGQRRQRRAQPAHPRLRRRPDRRRGPRRQRRGGHGDGHLRRRLRAPARGAGLRRDRRRDDRRQRPAHPRGEDPPGPVRRPVRRRGPRACRCSPTRPTATWPGSPPSGPRCCCATRATCCPSTPPRSARSRSSDRWPTPPRDTIGPWVFDFDLDETVTVLAGHPRPGRRRRPGRVRPRRAGRAARVPVAVRHVRREHPVGSRRVRRGRRVPAGRRPRRAEPMSRSSWWGSGRT